MESSLYTFDQLDDYLYNKTTPIVHKIWFWTIQNILSAKAQYKALKKYRDSWVLLNPSFTTVIWTKEHCESLVKKHYPEYLGLWKGYAHEIQRCDFARYFILHRYGGIYSDMDYECLLSFENLYKTWEKDVYFVQSPNHVLADGDSNISNSLIVSVKKECLFWKHVFIELDKSKDAYIRFPRHIHVMYSVGPRFLSRVYSDFKFRFRLGILPSSNFHPTSLIDDFLPEVIGKRDRTIYATHHSKGSWEKDDSRFLILAYRALPMILFILIVMLVPILIVRKFF